MTMGRAIPSGRRVTERSSLTEKRVNMLIGILGAIWVLNLFDSAVFAPAPMGLTIAF